MYIFVTQINRRFDSKGYYAESGFPQFLPFYPLKSCVSCSTERFIQYSWLIYVVRGHTTWYRVPLTHLLASLVYLCRHFNGLPSLLRSFLRTLSSINYVFEIVWLTYHSN